MGNKCCQIEEVASILNIIKALVENVSTSISTQTAITTIQQYINHFNGNLISDFRVELDGRTITIELANGNDFQIVLDRVLDVRLNQAGTDIIVTHSNPLLSNTIPLPVFNGLTIVNTSSPSNVNLSGDGTVLNPLKAEAIIKHSDTPNTTVTGDGTATSPLQVDITVSHQDSATISITGDGTQASPLVAEYIGPSISQTPIAYQRVDYYLRGWIDGLNQLNHIPAEKYLNTTRWIDSLTETQLHSIDLSLDNLPEPRLRVFKDTENKIIDITGEVYFPDSQDTEFPIIGGAIFILEPLSNATIIDPPSESEGALGILSGFYNYTSTSIDVPTLAVKGSCFSGIARMVPGKNKILLVVYPSRNISNESSGDSYQNLHAVFNLKYKY